MSASRRDRALAAVAIAVAVAAATAVGRSAGRQGRRATVIYPRGEDRLRFDHVRHVAHISKIRKHDPGERTCSVCHGKVGQSGAAAERHAPREAICRECHGDLTRKNDGPTERTRGGKGCVFCHRGYSGSGVPPKIDWPQARLRFSHRQHRSHGVACAACHRFAGRSQRVLPRMSECLACHRQKKATSRCVVCHLSGGDGRLLTRFGRRRLRPSGVLKGAAHTPQFGRRHAQPARADRRYCDSCHRPSDCLRCHAGSRKPVAIHASDYVTHHALDARRNQPRCSSCHRSQSFCLSCHQRLGVARSSVFGGFKPSTGKAFHPPGFNAVNTGPRHHSRSARRNIRTCASCHQEEGCIRCHGSRQIGAGGYSPHPPGFARSLKCSALASRNHRACLKCHPRGDRRLRCF